MHLRRTHRAAAGTPSRRGTPAPGLVWGLAAAFYFVALFHRMSLGVAALDAERRFHLAPGTLAVAAALQLGLYLGMQVPAGVAADRLGPRRTLAGGLALMAAGETAFAVAPSFAVALAGRGLVGVGDAFIFLNVLRLAQQLFPASRYAFLAALAGLAGAAGQVLTTVPLGASLGALGWTPTFAISGAVTALLILACLRVVPAAPRAPETAAEGVGTALRRAWASPATRHGFWVHLGLMGPFVTVTALWGFPFLVRAEGMTPGAARAHLLAAVVAFGVSSPLLGIVAARRPAARGPMLAALAMALTTCWAAVLAWPSPAPEGLLTTTLLLTGACGAAGLLGFDLAREGNPAHRGGAASGLVNLGGFSAAVLANLAIGRIAAATGGDLTVALWPMVACAGLAAAVLAGRALAGTLLRPVPAAS